MAVEDVYTKESYTTLKARDERISLTADASDRLEDRIFAKNRL